MVEAAPASPFEVAEPNLLFEFLVVALNAPAQLGGVDELMEARCSPEALRTNIWSVPPRPPATRSAATPLAGSQRASNLDARHERARGQSVRTTASAVPSRHVILRQACDGRPSASFLTEIGWCLPSRRNSFGGRP